jgi:hypothetical protein
MDFAVRQPRAHARKASHPRCPQCREETLVLQRRHVSAARLGDVLVTEFYECDCCDAGYQYSPTDNRWKRLSL